MIEIFTTQIATNHGHDFVSVRAMVDDSGEQTVEIAFFGRDPTTVTVRFALLDDVRSIAQSLLLAANAAEIAAAAPIE